jgi:hypothetical protein
MVDKVFSISSASVGSFSQNFSLELSLCITWLNSPTDLKFYMWRWFHSWVAIRTVVAKQAREPVGPLPSDTSLEIWMDVVSYDE